MTFGAVPRWPRAALGGLLVGLALPPWGWWPLAFAGVALFHHTVDGQARRTRAGLAWWFAAAWLLLGMAWMWFLSAPGYLAASALFAGVHAAAEAVVPAGRWSVVARPAAHTLAEAVRFSVPFGGVPLASLAIAAAPSPLLWIARIGGAVLLSWVVLQVGAALGSVAPALLRRTHVGELVPALVGLGACVALIGLAQVAPDGRSAQPGMLRLGVIQGGGEQGTRAISTDPRLVLDRHLAGTRRIRPGEVDAVLWPENVIDVATLAGSDELAEVVAEAARLDVPMIVSVTEDTADDRFLNAQVVVTPDGRVVSRYEKVRRVPFGEYMPLRGLLQALGAPTHLVPRDAVAGSGPAVLDVPLGQGRSVRLAVVISWEVFFGGRANAGTALGGEAIVNPTNGSSYTWTILQTQQVASSRLRAVEQGRWVVQAAPTGFSAFIDPAGGVHQRTSVSEAEVLIGTIELHRDRTWYSRLGDLPPILAAVGVAVICVAGRRPLRAARSAR